MTKKKGLFMALALAVASCAATAFAEPLRGLDWRLPEKGARFEGSTLIVDVPPDGGRAMVCATARIDISRAFREFGVAIVGLRFRATGVTEPDAIWNGVKVMISYVDADGDTQYTGVDSPAPKGTFDWRFETVRLSALANPRGIRDNTITLFLGLQGCTGHAEFDLASLDLTFEKSGLLLTNQDYIVRYPGDECFNAEKQRSREDAELLSHPGDKEKGSLGEYSKITPNLQNSKTPSSESKTNSASLRLCVKKPLRGCMLPERSTTEDDIATLASWGATMARFQIMRNWTAVNDCQDLDEYAQWIDSRLDNLADVLRWAQARGMKIVVDLHSPPGGKRQRPREMNMLHDDKYADAFVETWRRIARRFAGNPAIYGYDLINEPAQWGAARNNYWDLQRRAAEAVREIDPATPIIVASNMANSPGTFRYLSPLAMDNVIYQIHVYAPGKFTHQGVGGGLARKADGSQYKWPDPEMGWDVNYLRRILESVRAFQEKHHARIYVGEFSAIAWAPGADRYLRDCISLFEEYGWDWTYHAFREWAGWDVEKETAGPGQPPVPSADNPRKRALLDGFKH